MHVGLVHRDLHEVTRGGICTVYRALARRLIDRGHYVTLVTQAGPHPVRLVGGQVVALERTDDLDKHRRAVSAALLDVAPDVVDCSTWEAEARDYARGDRGSRSPVVVRGDLSAVTMEAGHLVAAEREMVHRADRLIAVSDFAARDLAAAHGIRRPETVPNGVDRRLFRPGPARPPQSGFKVTVGPHGHVIDRVPLPKLCSDGVDVAPWSPDAEGRPDVVWVGKVTPMKGWDRLERLVGRVRPKARVTVLLGHSPVLCPITLTGSDDVTILQDLDDADMPSFYRAADWLLSTSRWEGFGLAIAEALACGTPALVPQDLGTAPELLATDGGYTFRHVDDVAEMVTQPPPGVARPPERFDWDANAGTSARVYDDVTGGGR